MCGFFVFGVEFVVKGPSRAAKARAPQGEGFCALNEIGSGSDEPLGADEQEKTLAEESYFFLAFLAFLATFLTAFFAFLAAIILSPRDLVVLPHNAGSTIVIQSLCMAELPFTRLSLTTF
jgi:hypothetical protein